MQSVLADEREATIAGGLCLARLFDADEVVARAGPWIVATMAERLDLPPVRVIADLGALLFGGALRPHRSASVPGDDPNLAAAVRRYEDALLGRLAVDARLTSAGFAALRLPKEMHAQAVGILTAGVLSRIGFEGGMEVPP